MVLALTDADRSLLDQAWQLARERIPSPIAPDACRQCAELGRPCLAHRGPNDWPQP